VDNLGEGVNLPVMSPIFRGSEINVHVGSAGILVSAYKDGNDSSNISYKMDFSPTYSDGANIRFPVVETEAKNYRAFIPGTDADGKKTSVEAIRQGNFYASVTMVKMDSTTSIGRLNSQVVSASRPQAGIITNGEYNFYGKEFLLKIIKTLDIC
jgi:hypothetical protein